MVQQPYQGYQQYPPVMPSVTCPRCRTARAEGVSCPFCGLVVGYTGTHWQLAGAGRRFAGYLLFVLVPAIAALLAVAMVLVVLSTGDAYSEDEITTGMTWAIIASIGTPYVGYLVWWFALAGQGQSPVKKILGMRVVTAAGEPAGIGPMLLRSLVGQWLVGMIVPLYSLLDTLWLLWDRDRQCLHDKIGSTYVVMAEPVLVGAGPQQYGAPQQNNAYGSPQPQYGFAQPQPQPQQQIPPQRYNQPAPSYGRPQEQTWVAPSAGAAQPQQAAAFCRLCGSGYQQGARFCAVCGTPAGA